MIYQKQFILRLFWLTWLSIALFVYSSLLASAQSTDRVAPIISDVTVASSTDTSITVTWNTNENADSMINYGLQPDYGVARVPLANRTSHSITLNNLEPGRTYYFRVVSADEAGNQGLSSNYQVTLDGTPQTADGEGQRTPTPQEIVEKIEQIQNPQSLEIIKEATINQIQAVTSELVIVGPPTVVAETTFATVSWSTDRPATSEVRFSPSASFDGKNYSFSQSSTAGETTDHEVRVIGLDPFTEYSFQVRSTDTAGISAESRNYTFKTKASLPDIRNLRILKVEENAATLAWDTTVPAKALVEYQDLTTGEQNSVGRPTLATTHQMRLTDLTLGTRYVAFVISENSGGDRVRSQPIQFITVRDIAAPIMSNVTNESTIFPGGDSRIQTIIEWTTDEPAFCLMTYREGVAGGVDPFTIEKETVDYTTKHVQVVVDFAPATVYQFWLNCTDPAGNTAQSENFVLFTPIQEKNIIDLILENFESTFGWVKNIGA